MGIKTPTVYPSEVKALAAFGERLRLARQRRTLTTETVAKRADISRMTLYRAEQGDPSVSMGVYYRILSVLGLENALAKLADDDVLGRRLQDLSMPSRQK